MNELKNPLVKELHNVYKPIKKIGKWTILVKIDNPFSLCVCDDWYTIWGLMDDKYWTRYDMPEWIPEGVKNWIRTVYARKLQKENK